MVAGGCSSSSDEDGSAGGRPSRRSARRRAAQALVEAALRKATAEAVAAKAEIAQLKAVLEVVNGQAASPLAIRLLAIAPALKAQELEAAEGRPTHAPRRLLEDKIHTQQVAAKHLFPPPGQVPPMACSAAG